MEAHSNYYIESKHEPKKVIIISDQDPTGVTLTMKDEISEVQFSLCRKEMIEALEYVLIKIKARPI
jgi:hypothetical protein